VVEQTHVKAADVVHVVLDVMWGATSRTLTLVNFVCSIRAHVAIHIQLVIAHGTTTVTLSTEFLVVGYGPLSTLASH
jgi:hypothetical protein